MVCVSFQTCCFFIYFIVVFTRCTCAHSTTRYPANNPNIPPQDRTILHQKSIFVHYFPTANTALGDKKYTLPMVYVKMSLCNPSAHWASGTCFLHQPAAPFVYKCNNIFQYNIPIIEPQFPTFQFQTCSI